MKSPVNIAIGLLMLHWSIDLTAQSEIDALRYSQEFPTGTARFVSMGGAFGALGGDFSSLSLNPAGIGVYRKSEITFTPSIFSNSVNTTHYGSSDFGSKANFNFGNAGLVATFPSGGSRWVSSSIGFGYNRRNNFTGRWSIDGINRESSLLDLYKQQIEDGNFDRFGSDLAWNAYLIDIDSAGKFFTAIPKNGERQNKTINRSGAIGETVFSFGGNYDNRLYLGGTVGFTRVRFRESSVHTEIPFSRDTANPNNLKTFSLSEELSTNGSGINFKFGAIFRANDYLRIGGAVHTPTYYTLSDSWNSRIQASFDTINYDFSSPQGLNDYAIATPFKAIGSVGVLFGKAGLISIDYEYLDYSTANLSGRGLNNSSYSQANWQINDKYKSAGNIRIGTEWRLDPFALRAGFANFGNPFAEGVGNRARHSAFSAGFGIREEGYFIDFGYVLSAATEKYYLYDPALVQATNISSISQSYLVTLGLRF